MSTSSLDYPIPIPEDYENNSEENERRLWIGNLDYRVTEYALLKILQKFGTLSRFDFLYHKSGPDLGKPRGYCFVSYSEKQEAEKAMKALNGKLALSKRMLVKWAHKQPDNDTQKPSDKDKKLEIPENNLSTESKIRAIEMKLMHMEKVQPDFTLSAKPLALPGTSKYSSVVQSNQIKDLKRAVRKPYTRKDGKR